MSRRCALIAAFGAALFIFAGLAIGDNAQNTKNPVIRYLDAIAAKNGSLAYSVAAGSDLVLPFTVDSGGKLELYLGPLRGEHGDTVSIQSSIDDLAPVKDLRLAFSAADGSIFRLRLKAPALPHPGKYSGTLAVSLDGKLKQTDRLELTRSLAPRPAKLAVDWKSPAVHERTLSLANALGFIQPGTFNLQLRNASADWPAEGIFLRVLDVTAPPGNNFDPERHLKLTWNGAPADGLWRSPSANSSGRSIAPNQQVAIGGQAWGLAAGEYTVKVGLGAANATIDNENPVTLKVFVKHGVLLPMVTLLLAIAISWVATKGLEAQRSRGIHLAKVEEVRKGSWRQERDSMPAVAARAFLKQAEDRNERWFDALFGQDTTTAHIAKAELLAKVLDRVRDLRDRINRSGWRPLTVHRADKRLTGILASINPETVDVNAATKIEGQLAELDKWFDPKEHDTLYMGALKNDLETLVEQAKPEAFAPHDKLIEGLRGDIAKGRAQGAQASDIGRMERAYGILKILWERRRDRDDEALKRLFDLLHDKPQIDIEDFFDEADDIMWSRLVPADFKFIKPAVKELEPRRAYELIEFEIAPEHPRLGNNFLFKHKATYVWTLEVPDGDKRKTVTEQRTNEPRVVQYAPKPGEYYMTVSLEHKGGPADKRVHSKPLTIIRSSEYGYLSIFRFTEMAALGIATLFAMITGLATYYFGKAAFGSITDYVSLFVWGAGVDQAKNFVQQLGKTSGTG